MNVKDITKAREQLAKMPPRPWTNPWEENEDGEAEAIRDAEGKVVIGLGYYDGYHLEVNIEVCQIILAIMNTLYPTALAALEEAWGIPEHIRLIWENAIRYEDKRPDLATLLQEVAELALALNGRHEHTPDVELVQIGGIVANMLRLRAAEEK